MQCLELHETHPGMTRMKGQKMRSDPVKAPVHPWTFPTQPWSRIHIDFAGPVSGATYLVVVDAYSKFPEIVKMTSTTATATINALRDIFSRYGLPEIMVSDNGPQFIASEFQQFYRNNGIMHRTSAAYKPSTNGQAERVVQILKSAMAQARLVKQDVNAVITAAQASQLDMFWLSSSFLEYVAQVDMFLFFRSDHSYLYLKLAFPSLPDRGPGVWKPNTSILQDEALSVDVREFWLSWLKEKATFPSLAVWWVAGKARLKSLLRQYSRNKAMSRRDCDELVQVHSREASGEQVSHLIKDVETQLEIEHLHRAEGAVG